MKKNAFLQEDLISENLFEEDIEDVISSVREMFAGEDDIPGLDLSDEQFDLLDESENVFQSPIKASWDNLGDFSPGVATDARHSSGHLGVDLAAPKGTPIFPMAAGVVTKVGSGGKGGNTVSIQHADNIKTYYAHCDQVSVKPKQEVDLYTQIGTVGDSGNAQGTTPHLHFQVWKNDSIVNPADFFNVPKYNAAKFSPKSKNKKTVVVSPKTKLSHQINNIYKVSSFYNRLIKFLM
jgi:murein DD-endopeptidase MepM/ murein hydrolase activator NlpD